MTARLPRSNTSVKEHLLWQLDFLDTSLERYDAGHEHEALRVAVALRILCHDATPPPGSKARASNSLLTQAGYKPLLQVPDTARDHLGNPTDSLLVWELPPNHAPRLRAPVQRHDADTRGLLSFDEWWGGVAFAFGGVRYTRKELVLAVANADGGAHVDSDLPVDYHRLAVSSGLYGATSTKGLVVRTPVWELLRQIAYELQVATHDAVPGGPVPREKVFGKDGPSGWILGIQAAVVSDAPDATTGADRGERPGV